MKKGFPMYIACGDEGPYVVVALNLKLHLRREEATEYGVLHKSHQLGVSKLIEVGEKGRRWSPYFTTQFLFIYLFS